MPDKEFIHTIEPLIYSIEQHASYRQGSAGVPFFILNAFDGCILFFTHGIIAGTFRDELFEIIFVQDDLIQIAENVIDAEDSTIFGCLYPVGACAPVGTNVLYQDWSHRQKKHDLFVTSVQDGLLERCSFDQVLKHLAAYNDLTMWMWEPAFIIDCFDPIGSKIMEKEVFLQYPLAAQEKETVLAHESLTTNMLYEQVALSAILAGHKNIPVFLHSQFHWMQNDFTTGEELPLSFFEADFERLRSMYPDMVSQKKRIEYFKQFTSQNIEQKEYIFAKYVFSPRARRVVNTIIQLTDWREERKRKVQQSDWVLQQFLQQLCVHTGVDISLLKYAHPREYKLFRSDECETVLHQRQKYGVVYGVDAGTNEYFFVTDPEKVSRYFSLLATQFQEENGGQITGQVARKGRIEGVVKIVNHKRDFALFEDGDILVSSMTRPEFMPVIRRASGIITDEGGITCHAAVVSREMGIPCIIATKNATKVLKNGDRVLLDADSGQVIQLGTVTKSR